MKHSYKLARSVPLSWTAGTGSGNASSSRPERGPGHPPYPKVDAQPHNVGIGPESAMVLLVLLMSLYQWIKEAWENHLSDEMNTKNIFFWEKWTTLFCKKEEKRLRSWNCFVF